MDNQSIEMFDQNDLMQLLKIKRTTFFKLIQANCLPVVKIGKKYLMTRAQFESWMKGMEGREVIY